MIINIRNTKLKQSKPEFCLMGGFIAPEAGEENMGS